MKNSLKLILMLCLIGTLTKAEELPKATFDNCFYIMPLYERLRANALSYEEKDIEFTRMKQQLGQGNLYHRLGFSFIYPPGSADVRQVCEVAQKHRVHIGLIFGSQSHTRNDYRNIADQDFRLYQWRRDGVDWKGAYTSSGSLEVPEDERDYKIPTPSRYAKRLRDYNLKKAYNWAVEAKKLSDDFPGVITVINGPIEEELAIGGHKDTDKMADYSPFAITEFRDWLRHTGKYETLYGEYKGEGASDIIVGDLIEMEGVLRSPFFDDPNPDDNNNTGVSFNDHFGTNFTSWHLRYWDLQVYPDPITNEDFDCTPESGTGFFDGGFDAPRQFVTYDKFWRAWTWDIPDQNGKYPSGNPEKPAFGFRQCMVRNFIRDLMDTIATVGFPREMMYAHQIPGEALGNFTGAGGRNRSSASTVWTGYMEKSSNVGITRFGNIDPALMTQYADDWGIFEWHTQPNADPQSPDLYEVSIQALNRYYENKCHYLFPGWWSQAAPTKEFIFPLNDSKFAEAIGNFYRIKPEVPYHLQGATKDYSPPKVWGVKANVDDTDRINITWGEQIWNDLLPIWSDWAAFKHFEVAWSSDQENWMTATTNDDAFSTPVSDGDYWVKIRAVSKTGQMGEWSEIAKTNNTIGLGSIEVVPQFDTLYADQNMANIVEVAIETEGEINFDHLQFSIAGTGQVINSEPKNRSDIDKFWPFNKASEVLGVFKLNNVEFAGGIMSATVSPEEPIDPYFTFASSAVNGTEQGYIAFRMYSDVNSVGSLYWFYEEGHNSINFNVEKGWKVYTIEKPAEWINKTAIQKVRLDPINSANATMKLDWFAIDDQPISTDLQPAMAIVNNKAQVLTYPTGEEGSYTISASYLNRVDSAKVYTVLNNRAPFVAIQIPNKDTLMELGTTAFIKAGTSDVDGKIASLQLKVDDQVVETLQYEPFEFLWTPTETGSFSIELIALDNAGAVSNSSKRTIEVKEQSGYPNGAHTVPGIIEAENYDEGGQGISFFDTDATNRGSIYRSDAVDIDRKGDNNYMISWTDAGEWMEYTINVPHDMRVNIKVIAAIWDADFCFELYDEPLTEVRREKANGGVYPFEEYWFHDVYLHQGTHNLKLKIVRGTMQIDQIHLMDYVMGINEYSLEKEWSVFPNPANDQVFIQCESKCNVKVYDINGRQRIHIDLNENTNQIDISHLDKGIYIFQIETNAEKIFKKIIKQ